MRSQSVYSKDLVLLVLALTIAAALLPGCGQSPAPAVSQQGAKTLYTCGMHPQVVQDKPGNCPICGMKLTPIRKQPDTAKHGPEAPGERKVKYFKSTMRPGETRPTPGKDS